ncbi:MAG: Glycosyltransferase [Parcubacteria group bacterium GW2011_GWC1_42_11]|uniref:Glycosyltransferase n=1 Tax=Candidatus Nomurabacteria bacterium GW2011_GWC2_42_20 TaxID=1618756 RepID=A0A0G0ZGN0_9BACT|nr:MAG: Glycosyltransferase [Parcubacteria group bacterium GW2011_GWC1_42_11]KKS47920.1 MAG: Glycosyltransferase [Candidatus Nomurabacteria bacterium GW2011_GWC2_42_20]KKS59096.1 MAG: Glycosyltransferase [Candidatus Nomurabacteria bacterium GW2011_GWA2_42_41]KKT09687.1 MAG: Glycosyltransferase [Candidatus Nomurabacteria bacterium GW2011_GWB1_43_20]TAN36625.1 MAG: glycosyltransferase [Patescibacteria group bacterium]HBH71691.1 hypothetical protein [Candidatus Yonathbacteria bacterium]
MLSMRFLILTQKVDRNDPVLGFFHRWIEEFAKHCERVTVIALGVGEYNLPKNVKVFSLGKEHGISRLKYLINFYRLIWRERKNYNAVFVHMNQVYVVLGGFFWRLMRKPVGLWYVHREKTISLCIAEKLVNIIFTSTPESFQVPTKKAHYLGHGIDILDCARPQGYHEPRNEKSILCVGRLSAIKDQKTIIHACAILVREGIDITCTFVGNADTKADMVYKNKLLALVANEKLQNNIFFIDGISHAELIPFFWKSGIHVNGSPTGGLDKVVIESMAAGAIPVVANEAFRNTLGKYSERLVFDEGDADSLADYLRNLLVANDKYELRAALMDKARDNFDLAVLVKKIVTYYETSR